MQSANGIVGEANEKRLRRLKYVTENFNSFQGLSTAVLGVQLLTYKINDLFEQDWLHFLTWLVCIACLLAYLRYLPKYYERRFGRVEQPAPQMSNAYGCAFFGIIIVLLVCSLVVPSFGRYLDEICAMLSHPLHQMLGDPNHRLNFGPILYWLLLSVLSISFRRGQPIDLQNTSFWLGGTLLWAVIITLPLYRPDLANVVWWKIFNTGGIGISLILAGIYNHLNLIFLLPRPSEVEQ